MRYGTISARDCSGEQMEFHAKILDFGAYVRGPGSENAVVLKASGGATHAGQIIRQS